MKKLFGKDTPANILLPKEWETRKYVTTGERNSEGLARVVMLVDGLVGGWVANSDNISQNGNCFVYSRAEMHDNSRLYSDAVLDDEAKARGMAKITDRARVGGMAEISGKVEVMGDANVYNRAKIYGNAIISDHAKVSGNAKVYDEVFLQDRAIVDGEAEVGGSVKASGTAKIRRTGKCTERQHIIAELEVDIDGGKNMAQSIYAQTLSYPFNDKIVLFKVVQKKEFFRPTGILLNNAIVQTEGVGLKQAFFTFLDLRPGMAYRSLHDDHFLYRVGHTARAIDPYECVSASCASGLHFSYLKYWSANASEHTAYLAAEIMMKDIISVQEGKVRCRKAKVLCEVTA
jgi:NDP-sugar pyrophosphorylase family protein